LAITAGLIGCHSQLVTWLSQHVYLAATAGFLGCQSLLETWLSPRNYLAVTNSWFTWLLFTVDNLAS